VTAVTPEAVQESVRKSANARRFAIPRESVVLFGVAYVAYAVLGYFVVVRWNIVVGDALSRLAHAYFVWFNEPPKLTAIGFVWPPLMTIVLLPLALVKPLATTLLALPLTSAFFGAALVVTLDRTLAILGLGRPIRFPLLALIALNPMVLYYAANGMGETLYLFLLTAGVYYFLRWHRDQRLSYLVLASVTLALGLMTRYEILFWVVAIGVGVVGVLVRRGAPRAVLEGSTIAFLAPACYALGLWMFFNWLILGDPLWWLHSEVALTFTETQREVLDPLHVALAKSAGLTLSLSWTLFPATFAVLGGLVVLALLRRDFVALTLAAVLALNPVTTAVLAVLAKTDFVYQLRYNMRPLPLALIGIAWIYRQTHGRGGRAAVAAGGIAVLSVSLVFSWNAMHTYERQAFEQAFVRALATWEDQEGTRSHGSGLPVGVAPEDDVAGWIRANVQGDNQILVDDAQGFGVMLFTGSPGLFLDRIDVGDAEWLGSLNSPWGRVEYLLMTRSAAQGRDLVREAYPNPAAQGLRRVFANERWLLVRVPERPRAPGPTS
jgi:hypothetical protein